MTSGTNLLLELESNVRRESKPSPAPAPQQSREFPEHFYSDHPEFDWGTVLDAINDAQDIDGIGVTALKNSFEHYNLELRFTKE